MSIIQRHLIDIDTSHTPDFVFQRTPPLHDGNLVMCFRTAASILTCDGMKVAEPGDCIVHSVDFRLFHRSAPDSDKGFRNDWFYVNPEHLEPLMQNYRLPWNKLVSTGKPEFFVPHMRQIKDELFADDEFSERAIRNHLEKILISLARAYKWSAVLRNNMTQSERHHFELLSQLRRDMLEDCRRQFTIEELAAEAALSKERFSVLYRKFFSSSPYSELIDARLVIARRLLASTHLTIKEISIECGWDDLHYFSRVFKKKNGVSPSHYRNLSQGETPRDEEGIKA